MELHPVCNISSKFEQDRTEIDEIVNYLMRPLGDSVTRFRLSYLLFTQENLAWGNNYTSRAIVTRFIVIRFFYLTVLLQYRSEQFSTRGTHKNTIISLLVYLLINFIYIKLTRRIILLRLYQTLLTFNSYLL